MKFADVEDDLDDVEDNLDDVEDNLDDVEDDLDDVEDKIGGMGLPRFMRDASRPFVPKVIARMNDYEFKLAP